MDAFPYRMSKDPNIKLCTSLYHIIDHSIMGATGSVILRVRPVEGISGSPMVPAIM